MKQRTLGILGGLGPLASVEFIKTIYEKNMGTCEQESPICYLHCDPTIPPRTESIAAGNEEIILQCLLENLEKLLHIGSDKIVIACVTMHYFIPRLPIEIQSKLISLVDLMVDQLRQRPEKYLLLSSKGTVSNQVLKKNSNWSILKSSIVIPEEIDQEQIHQCLEKIKINQDLPLIIDLFKVLLDKYELTGWVFACSELHILHKYLLGLDLLRPITIIDPLLFLANNLNYYLDEA